MLKVKELEKKMVQEVEARAKLEGKVIELEGIIIKMREEATTTCASRSRPRSLSKEEQFSKSSRFGGVPGEIGDLLIFGTFRKRSQLPGSRWCMCWC